MNTNIRIVAVPFTTADKALEVTRSAGFKYPAYSDANTPVVHKAIAASRIRQRADQVNDKRKDTNDEKLGIHAKYPTS
jgi:hypothetical protein